MTGPGHIAVATRHLDSAARSYAAGHAKLALLDLRLALVAVADAIGAIVSEVSP